MRLLASSSRARLATTTAVTATELAEARELTEAVEATETAEAEISLPSDVIGSSMLLWSADASVR